MGVFIGIDASIRCTGLCVDRGGGDYHTLVIEPSKTARGMERLAYLQRKFHEFVSYHCDNVQGVAMEGYAFGVRGGRLADLAEWGGMIRMELYHRNIPTIIVPPMTLKKYLRPESMEKQRKMDKDQMLLQVYKRYGKECHTNDEADALVLADFARNYYLQTKNLPIRQKEALQKAAILVSKQVSKPRFRSR